MIPTIWYVLYSYASTDKKQPLIQLHGKQWKLCDILELSRRLQTSFAHNHWQRKSD